MRALTKGALVLAVVGVAAGSYWLLSKHDPSRLPEGTIRYLATEEGLAALERDYGIEVQAIRRAASGFMLDFRYRVTDADKAARLHGGHVQPYLLEPETGFVVVTPGSKIGSLRQTKRAPKQGKVYSTMFSNPGRRLKKGERVTVLLDKVAIEEMEIDRTAPGAEISSLPELALRMVEQSRGGPAVDLMPAARSAPKGELIEGMTQDDFDENKRSYYCDLAHEAETACQGRGDDQAFEHCLKMRSYYTYERHCRE